MRYILVLLFLLLSGCVIIQQEKHKISNPTSIIIQEQLKSKNDIEYFNKIKENSRYSPIEFK